MALVWLALPLVSSVPVLAADAAVRREVIVYGGTPAGVMAAVAAARHGHTVALIELNNHVGGMISGGLVNTDIGDRTTVGGLAKEFLQRAVQSPQRQGAGGTIMRARCASRRRFHASLATILPHIACPLSSRDVGLLRVRVQTHPAKLTKNCVLPSSNQETALPRARPHAQENHEKWTSKDCLGTLHSESRYTGYPISANH